MKLWAMPCRAIQDGRVMVESSDKTWSTGEGVGKPFSIPALRTPCTVWKGKHTEQRGKSVGPDPFLVICLLPAKMLQSCPVLCNPWTVAYQAPPSMGFYRQEYWSGLPFPSPMHENLKVKGKSLSRVRLLVTPWTAAHQAPLSMGFSRQEYWSGMPLPSLSPVF